MFVRNNLQFRILSSVCISKFRDTQAAALNEIEFNKRYKFHEVSKSALLLQYDLWFGWLIHVERVLVKQPENSPLSNDTTKSIIASAETVEIHSYDHILKREKEVFSEEYLKGHFSVRKFSFDAFKSELDKVSGQVIGNAMYSLTHALITMMENSLYELQELDHILFSENREDSFLSIQTWDLNLLKETNNCVVLKRGELFCKVYGVSKFNLKNYTLDDTPNIGLLLNRLRDSDISIGRII